MLRARRAGRCRRFQQTQNVPVVCMYVRVYVYTYVCAQVCRCRPVRVSSVINLRINDQEARV
jgi:hypothetical protein